MANLGFASGAAERTYIEQRAQLLGLDPEAVLAVAAHEGVTLPAEVGDSGTSFGPWQMHAGGALPQSVWQKGPAFANEWANSQAGIDYALAAITGVAKGLKGPDAVRAIVYGFEHPSDPAGETQRAVQTYQGAGGPTVSDQRTAGGQNISLFKYLPMDPSGELGSIISGGTSPGQALHDLTSPFTFGERAFKFLTSWRFVEVLGGFLLLLLGLALLGRQFGVTVPSPVPAAAAQTTASGVGSTFQFQPGEEAYAAAQPTSRRSASDAAPRIRSVAPINDVSRPLRKRAATA